MDKFGYINGFCFLQSNRIHKWHGMQTSLAGPLSFLTALRPVFVLCLDRQETMIVQTRKGWAVVVCFKRWVFSHFSYILIRTHTCFFQYNNISETNESSIVNWDY